MAAVRYEICISRYLRTDIYLLLIRRSPKKGRQLKLFFVQGTGMYFQIFKHLTIRLHGRHIALCITSCRGLHGYLLRRSVDPGGYDGDAQFVACIIVIQYAHKGVGFRMHGVGNNRADFLNFVSRNVLAGGDVIQDSLCAADGRVFQQWTCDRAHGRFTGAVFARGDAGAHQRQASFTHDGAHIGEVQGDSRTM